MITIPRSVRILIGSTPIDMRKSIDGLMAIVQQELQEDAHSGHLFVFVSFRCDQVKILAYRIERAALYADLLGTPEHIEMRQTHSKAVMDHFRAWLPAEQGRHPPRRPMGEAIRYAVTARESTAGSRSPAA